MITILLPLAHPARLTISWITLVIETACSTSTVTDFLSHVELASVRGRADLYVRCCQLSPPPPGKPLGDPWWSRRVPPCSRSPIQRCARCEYAAPDRVDARYPPPDRSAAPPCAPRRHTPNLPADRSGW